MSCLLPTHRLHSDAAGTCRNHGINYTIVSLIMNKPTLNWSFQRRFWKKQPKHPEVVLKLSSVDLLSMFHQIPTQLLSNKGW